MKQSSVTSSRCVRVMLSVVMLIGTPVFASETVEIRSSDYLLGQEGLLAGGVFNKSGQPVAGLPVQVLHENQVIAVALSDEQGHFAVQGLRNGQHTLKLGASQQPVRFWNHAAAPPAAQARMAIVVDEEVVRGQCGSESCGEGCGGSQGGLGWGTAVGVLVIGGAVATTLALTLDDNNSGALVASP